MLMAWLIVAADGVVGSDVKELLNPDIMSSGARYKGSGTTQLNSCRHLQPIYFYYRAAKK